MIIQQEPITDDIENGFMDVAANALAVMIFVTMIVLLVAAPPALRGEIFGDTSPPLAFPAPLDEYMSPLNDYFLVTSDGVTPVDLNAFARELKGGANNARTEQGSMTFLVERNWYRDIDEFKAKLIFDISAMRRTAIVLTEDADLKTFAKTTANRFKQKKIAPTFILAEDGIDQFVSVYWALRDTDVVLRWARLNERDTITIDRGIEGFERRKGRWQ